VGVAAEAIAAPCAQSIGGIQLVLGDRVLRTDGDRAGQALHELRQQGRPAAVILPEGQIHFECGHRVRIDLDRGDATRVLRLVLELNVDGAAADAAGLLLRHADDFPGHARREITG